MGGDLGSGKFSPNDFCAYDHRAHLSISDMAGEIFQSQSGANSAHFDVAIDMTLILREVAWCLIPRECLGERLIGSIRHECVDHIVVWARGICAGSCEPMPAITMTSEHTGH